MKTKKLYLHPEVIALNKRLTAAMRVCPETPYEKASPDEQMRYNNVEAISEELKQLSRRLRKDGWK